MRAITWCVNGFYPATEASEDSVAGFISIDRNAGLFRAVSCIWVLQLDSSPTLPPFTDVILDGVLSNAVFEQAGGLNIPPTERPAVSLAGSGQLTWEGPTNLEELSLVGAFRQTQGGDFTLATVSLGTTTATFTADFSAGSVSVDLGSGPSSEIYTAVPVGQWVSIAIVLESAGQRLRLYVDSVLAMDMTTTISTGLPSVAVGSEFTGQLNNLWVFDEVRCES